MKAQRYTHTIYGVWIKSAIVGKWFFLGGYPTITDARNALRARPPELLHRDTRISRYDVPPLMRDVP